MMLFNEYKKAQMSYSTAQLNLQYYLVVLLGIDFYILLRRTKWIYRSSNSTAAIQSNNSSSENLEEILRVFRKQ